MSHVPNEAAALPEVPATISDRYVAYHDFDFDGYLQSLEQRRPGLFDALIRMIAVMESNDDIGEITIDIDEEDFLRPVTLWAESTFPSDEREEHLLRYHRIAKDTLGFFSDLVLVAVV